MKPQDFRLRQSIITFVLLMSFVGCSVPTTPTNFPVATSLPVTRALTPTPIPTPNFTLTSSPVPPTDTPRPTWTPMPPTLTAAPTLTTDKEGALVLGLLQNNAGCQLPCWWGFTPNKTAWQVAKTFFASLGKAMNETGRSYVSYEVEFSIAKHNIQISQEYAVVNDTIDMIWVGAGTVRNAEAIFGDPLFAQDLRQYMLPHVLNTYGQPEEALIRAFRGAPSGGWTPFHLMLFYPQQGILINYQGPSETKGTQIQWCPSKTNISLWLWSPDRKFTLEEIARHGPNLSVEELHAYRRLDEATGMNVEEFYTTFTNANNRICIETPANMWP